MGEKVKNKVTLFSFICLYGAAMLLTSCSSSTATNSNTATTSTGAPIPSAATSINKATSAPTTGNWWDKLGAPQYGGEMVLRMNTDFTAWDPDTSAAQWGIYNIWMEQLTADDWKIDPATFDYRINWRPSDYVKGNLAESWEMTDSSTYVIHLRQGVHWQDITPVNGREFTADDVVFHYNRMFGLGSGYSKPAPMFAVSNFSNMSSVTATDKYTVVFKWSTPNPEFILETIQASGGENTIENSDAVKLWGDVGDWHHAIGTGPFILKDYVSGSSASLVKNPNYWAHDERYPQNLLPYADSIKYLIIPDDTTALAAMRTGKIDVIDGMTLAVSQQVAKSNPEILQFPTPAASTSAIVPMYNKAPYTDLQVRQALQLAIDLPTIASSFYSGSASPSPSSLTSNFETGWGFPYSQWPQSLKDQYSYNPTKAKQLLSDAGFPNGFKTNIIVASNADMDLVQIVKAYFQAIGVDMSVQTMDPASWTTYVRTNHKADAMAMIANGGDPIGLTYEPMRQLNRFRTGYAANWGNVSDPVFDSFLPKAMGLSNLADIKQVVKDANDYAARQHFVVSLLQPMQYSFCQPWLKGYDGQSFSVGGRLGSPQIGYFYTARFWIDQGLKKSLGH